MLPPMALILEKTRVFFMEMENLLLLPVCGVPYVDKFSRGHIFANADLEKIRVDIFSRMRNIHLLVNTF